MKNRVSGKKFISTATLWRIRSSSSKREWSSSARWKTNTRSECSKLSSNSKMRMRTKRCSNRYKITPCPPGTSWCRIWISTMYSRWWPGSTPEKGRSCTIGMIREKFIKGDKSTTMMELQRAADSWAEEVVLNPCRLYWRMQEMWKSMLHKVYPSNKEECCRHEPPPIWCFPRFRIREFLRITLLRKIRDLKISSHRISKW